MKKTIIAITGVLFTFIITTFIVSIIILNGDKILKNFDIISIENISTKYIVKFEKVKAADHYNIVVYDEEKNILYDEMTNNTENEINLKNIEYDNNYKLLVFAYDKLGDSITVNNPYNFVYTEPTFDSENNLVLTSNEDYTLLINGDLTKKDYKIRLYNQKELLKEDKLTKNEYQIPNKLFTNKEEVITANIYENNEIINTINLYSKMSPLKDLTITSPSNGDVLDYNDVAFTYNGGDNATKYLLQIYDGNDLIKEQEILKNRCVISCEFFNKAETYTIKIKALYNDYEELSKEAKVEFTMNEKDTLKPVFINVNQKYVKSGTSIILGNPNPDGKIYYTIDGSDPTTNGLEYTTPLIANGNMEIKTIIKEEKKNNSIIGDFNINIGTKKTYSVYLSPSNQSGNLGVPSVGYSNEMKEMNDLSNYIEKRLKANGVKVYRNNPAGNINLWTSDSRYYGVDLHLAIHSNASETGSANGIETWVDEQVSASYSLANLIQNNLMSIYYKTDGTGNRGVKYANGNLGEVNDLVVPLGILVETAYHDNKDDALWIMNNKEKIGNTIADSILKYFGII